MMKETRRNRDACAGLLVMAKSHATDGFPEFARLGHNVLVVWDENDPMSDAYLHAGLLATMSLATRHRKDADEGDIDALRDIEQRIASEVERLSRIRGHNDTIRRNSDSIADEIRKAERKLELLLSKAKDTLRALNIELIGEEVEASAPVTLPSGSLENASGAIDGRHIQGSDTVT
jgi:hypothetical protein